MDRRSFLKSSALGVAGAVAAGEAVAQSSEGPSSPVAVAGRNGLAATAKAWEVVRAGVV